MKQISMEMARYLFNAKEEVYRLYEDGTESLVENENDIREHDDFFGTEHEGWKEEFTKKEKETLIRGLDMLVEAESDVIDYSEIFKKLGKCETDKCETFSCKRCGFEVHSYTKKHIEEFGFPEHICLNNEIR